MPSKALVIQIGDGPSLPSGLGRIGRGLAGIWDDVVDRRNLERPDPTGVLPVSVDFLQIGLGEPATYSAFPWKIVRAWDQAQWGAETLRAVLGGAERAGVEKVGVFTVWDPARCYEIQQCVAQANKLDLEIKLWGYFAIDARGPGLNGAFGGPAAFAVQHYDRVIPYTRFGEAVLKASGVAGKVLMSPLPHWLDAEWFEATVAAAAPPVELFQHVPRLKEWAQVRGMTVGCVATNQRRKDWALFFESLAELHTTTTPWIKVWIHTDFQITQSWSIPELAECFIPGVPVLITGALHSYLETGEPPEVSDAALRWLYSQCDVTAGIGLGEGWGYPLIESLACGVPVVHGDYAGGAEILGDAQLALPKGSDRTHELIKPQQFFRDGPYALSRPVFNPKAWGDAMAELARDAPQLASRRLAASHFSAKRVVPLWRERLSTLLDELLSVDSENPA